MFWVDYGDVLITLNGFQLWGSDAFGCEWHAVLGGLSGAYDGTDSTLSTSTKMWTGGYYTNIPQRTGRTISLEGYVAGGCPEIILQAWERFKSYILVSSSFRVEFSIGSYVRWVNCIQSSSAPIVEFVGHNIFKWSLSLVSLDAGLYAPDRLSGQTGLPKTVGGWWLDTVFDPYETESPDPSLGDGDVVASYVEFNEEVVSGALVLYNPGTLASPVEMQIRGVCSNPRVEHYPSGRVMAFQRDLTASNLIVCDGSAHEITLDGVVLDSGSVVYRQWAYAEPGENIWRFSADSGDESARLYVSFYPMYV